MELQALNIPATRLAEFCRRHHVQRLSLFGSFLRGAARADSDVDLLVEFEPGQVPTLFGLARMELELSDLFGHPVDLRTAEDLSKYFRREVRDVARVLFAA